VGVWTSTLWSSGWALVAACAAGVTPGDPCVPATCADAGPDGPVCFAAIECIDERAAAACCDGRWVRTERCSTCDTRGHRTECTVTSTTFTECGEVYILRLRSDMP
jgi:hypothetical protein